MRRYKYENKRLPLTKKYVSKGVIPNYSGLYKFYDGSRRLIYVGVAKNNLRHRVQSYYQEDSIRAHPTKALMRNHIRSYEFDIMPISKARRLEHKIKMRTKFNFK